jgi:hypothetical protein
MLASLISYRPNRKKVSSKSPFSLRRPDPTSPHPYATQVFDIGDSSYEELEPAARPSASVELNRPPQLPTEKVISPRVDVNIDFTPADWFPSHFLKSDSIAGPSGASAVADIASADAGKSGGTLQTRDTASEEEEEEEEDDDTSSLSEDVVSSLQAMDVRVSTLLSRG